MKHFAKAVMLGIRQGGSAWFQHSGDPRNMKAGRGLGDPAGVKTKGRYFQRSKSV